MKRTTGTVIASRYELLERLGSGDASPVWRAYDLRFERRIVAVRFLDEDSPGRGGMWRSLFRTQAAAAASLRCDNIVGLLDYGEDDAAAYLVSEYVEGRTLDRILEALSAATVLRRLRWLEDLCAGLGYAHRVKLVHRDLKPSSLIVDDESDRLRILDFGMVQTTDPDDVTALPLGTVCYMAPEQTQGWATVDYRSNIFTVGVVAYQLLSGEMAFGPAGDVHRLITNIRHRPPRPLLQLVPSMPRGIAAIVEKALEKQPENRYQDLAAMERDIAGIRAELETEPGQTLVEPGLPTIPSAARGRAVQNPLDDNVQFTVFRPKTLEPGEWCPLLVFAHLSERRPGADPTDPDPVAELEREAAARLDSVADFYRTTDDSLEPVPHRGMLTIVPTAVGIEFNPPSRSFVWTEPVHCEEFRMCADAASGGRVVHGRIGVYFGSIVLAEISLTLKIGPAAKDDAAPRLADTARRYRKIFASYSHDDRAIVDEFREYALAIGDRYLADVADLRSGERWQPGLERLIREADVFQLFWSWNSLGSSYVRDEWEYALALHRPAFIRPVYWDAPLPSRAGLPPEALRQFHFQRIRPPAAVAVARPAVEELQYRRQREAATRLATAQERLAAGEFEAALSACEQVLTLDPAHSEARNLLERARAALDEQRSRQREIEVETARQRAAERVDAERARAEAARLEDERRRQEAREREVARRADEARKAESERARRDRWEPDLEPKPRVNLPASTELRRPAPEPPPASASRPPSAALAWLVVAVTVALAVAVVAFAC